MQFQTLYLSLQQTTRKATQHHTAMEQNKRKQLRDEISKIFSENNVNYEFDIDRNNHVNITIEDGDWKHDHLKLKHIMTLNNFICADLTAVDEEGNGDDTYSAEYCFVKM